MFGPLGTMAIGLLSGQNPLQQLFGGTQIQGQQPPRPTLWQQLTGQQQTQSPWQQQSPWVQHSPPSNWQPQQNTWVNPTTYQQWGMQPPQQNWHNYQQPWGQQPNYFGTPQRNQHPRQSIQPYRSW
ncbi:MULTISPECIES: hypothetical protein [Bacillaceae]|uniref:Uncharacterized protein n=1 Tax=Evansella alkalicola TaxID=745819 RepID=A0ABS6JTA6_9BACI|nr:MULTISPECIES: hypothetical protein [Bacillaceae]MBU9721477.1 hypothetical protein [Bacillus alkalicola]